MPTSFVSNRFDELTIKQQLALNVLISTVASHSLSFETYEQGKRTRDINEALRVLKGTLEAKPERAIRWKQYYLLRIQPVLIQWLGRFHFLLTTSLWTLVKNFLTNPIALHQMTYPNEPTIDESINQFFTFIEEYSEREDFDDEIENWDEEEEGEKHPYFQNLEAFENVKTFIEEAYEIAFGEDALHREFHPDEVIERLKEFSDDALKYEEGEENG